MSGDTHPPGDGGVVPEGSEPDAEGYPPAPMDGDPQEAAPPDETPPDGTTPVGEPGEGEADRDGPVGGEGPGRRVPLDARRAGRHRDRRRRRRRRRLVLTVVGVVVLVVVAVVAWYEIEAHPFGGPGARVVVYVKSGEGSGGVAGALERRGVVGSSLALRLSLFVHGSPVIEPGGYVLHTNESFATVRSILDKGPDIFDVDVLPGYTVAEAANALAAIPGDLAVRFVAESKSGAVRSSLETSGSDSLEGLLGTGTYQVMPEETDRQLLTQMVGRFERQAAQAGLTAASAARLGLTPYQVVTVASIAQKEGYFDRYMGKVARVVYNRLADGMPLDMTSTVLYSLGQDGGTVTAADRKLDTPYNTYIHTGLTPTPICFPSEAALAGAVAPPAGTWLYFTVVDKSGKTAFTDTYTRQLANEKLGQSRGAG